MRITKLSKVLSLVLVICIAVGMVVTTNAEEVITEVITEAAQDAEAIDAEAVEVEAEPEVKVIPFDETYEYKFIERFDIMSCYNHDDFQSDKPVTRAEFASMLCALGGLDPITGGNEFVDIGGNEYEKHINAVNLKNLMRGFDKYTFLPDKEIILSEAVKPILNLAGYETLAAQQGGYPNGYMQLAGDLDMLDGMSITADDVVTRGEMARLIYNSRNVKIYGSIDFVDIDGEIKIHTLMTDNMNIDCVRGLVKDNGITGLRSDEKSRLGYITIGKQQFKIRKQSEVRTYVGRYVEAYYTSNPDSDGERTIEYIHLDKVYTGKEITFDINKFISLSGRVIKFENEKEKEQKIELTSSVNIIFNNKAVKSIKESMFDYDYGTVTYVPARKGAADTIIIEGIVSWFLSSADKEFEYISTTNECRAIDGERRIEIPKAEIGKTIFIEDYHGWDGDTYDVSAYDVVDIVKSGNYVFIRVTEPNIQEKIVKGKTKIDGKPAIMFNDGDTFVVSPYYSKTEEYNEISSGNLYYVYRNREGHVVRLENITSADLKVAYLIRSIYDPIEETGFIKILTTDKKYVTLPVAEKITFSDNKNVTTPSMKFMTAHNSALHEYEGVINYAVNKLGLVKKIYLPVDRGVDREFGRLGCIYDDVNVAEYWETGRTNFGELFLAAANVGTYMKYTSEVEMENRYKYGAVNAIGATRHRPTKAYNFDPNSLYAEILFQEASSSASPKITTGGTVVVVTDMSQETIYADENYVVLQTVTVPAGTPKTYYAKPEDLANAMDIVTTSPEKYWQVEKGDIIIIRPKTTDNTVVDGLSLVWDANAPNPIDPEKGRKGSVPCSIGYGSSSKPAQSNPFVWYGTNYAGPGTDITSQWRSLFGYAYYVDAKGGLIVSSQELSSKEYDPNYDKKKYFNKAFLPPATAMITVLFKDNQVEARKGSISDIKTYLTDGNNCSRIFVRTDYGTPTFVVIFNGEMK